MITLQAKPLSADAFQPFGRVIEADGSRPEPINAGSSVRYLDLAEVACEGNVPMVGMVRAQPFTLPLTLQVMERHPFGSQMFFPLNGEQMAVVVASDPKEPKTYQAFITNGAQGVSYNAGIWHHPLAVLDRRTDLLVVDRADPDSNLEKTELPAPMQVTAV